MTITDRDRKILAVLAVLAVVAGYWFLLLSPKRAEVAKVDEELALRQQERDAALARVQAVRAARSSFRTDYAEMVRLGKAIPTAVDMPSLLVQLDSAADGAHIDVEKITVGARVPASGAAPAAPAPPDGGGEAEEGQSEQTDTQTSENARDGSVPVGGGQAGGAAAASSAGVAGLDSVPIEFGFAGSYFDLADFFHRLKRFVRVGERGIVVRGRLMTIDSFSFAQGTGGGARGELQATVKATVYLAPKAEGATAGATPAGPAPQPAQAASSSPAPPTATAQP